MEQLYLSDSARRNVAMTCTAGGCAFSKDYVKMVENLNLKRPCSNFIQIRLISNVWAKKLLNIFLIFPHVLHCVTVTEMI